MQGKLRRGRRGLRKGSRADCRSVLPLALVRNVSILQGAIFRQACFAWWSVDNISILVASALLPLPKDELAAEFAVSPTRVSHPYPIRTAHRYLLEADSASPLPLQSSAEG